MAKLVEQVREVIRNSIRTEQAYLRWIRQFILFHNKRHPSEMGRKEVSTVLSHLAVNRKVSASTQNQALSALLFLCHAPARGRLRYPHGTGVARAQGCRHYHDLYSCPK